MAAQKQNYKICILQDVRATKVVGFWHGNDEHANDEKDYRNDATTHHALSKVHRGASLQLPQPLQLCRIQWSTPEPYGSLKECAGATSSWKVTIAWRMTGLEHSTPQDSCQGREGGFGSNAAREQLQHGTESSV